MNARVRGVVQKIRHLAVLAATAAPVLAFAQETDAFTTAVTEATTKIGIYGAALVGVSAAGVVLAIAAKYVKKIRGAS